MKFIKTVRLNSVTPFEVQMQAFQVGQWMACSETGIRGQYLGCNRHGDPVVHWIKPGSKFDKGFAVGNHWLRGFAKGAKPMMI